MAACHGVLALEPCVAVLSLSRPAAQGGAHGDARSDHGAASSGRPLGGLGEPALTVCLGL